MYYSTTLPSPLGEITLACDSAGQYLVGLWLAGQKYHGDTLAEAPLAKADIPLFSTAEQWLADYFAGKQPAIADLPLAPRGSEFRQQVWRILCAIPYGETISYGEIARQMAAKLNRNSMSSQAVGGAVGHNPISIIIPCHRVVGTNGSLTGYAGGLGLKIKLLELEGVDLGRFFVPTKGTAL